MLHHGSQSNGHDGQHCTDEFGASINGKQAHGLGVQGDAEPVCLHYAGEVHRTGDQSHHIRNENAQQDGKNFDHALAPDVAHDYGAQSHKGQQPVGLAVGDGGGSQNQTDGDDDGAGHHRREQLHDATDAEYRNQQAEHHIHQTAQRYTRTGVGQHFGVGNGLLAAFIHQHGRDDGKTAQISKRGTQKSGNLAAGDQMKQQRAQTGTQQSGGNAQSGNQGYKHGCAKHGEHMLQAKNQYARFAQRSCIIDALRIVGGWRCVFCFLAHRRKSLLIFIRTFRTAPYIVNLSYQKQDLDAGPLLKKTRAKNWQINQKDGLCPG